MPRCAAIGCNNNGNHSFPKTLRMRRLWEKAIRIRNFKATDNSRLCSEHFIESDYEGDSSATGLPQVHRYLKKTAIPTVFSWRRPISSTTIARERRYLKRILKKEIFPLTSQETVVDNVASALTEEILEEIPPVPYFQVKVEMTTASLSVPSILPSVQNTISSNVINMSELFLSPEHVLHGGYFHSTLRKLQEPNTSIEPHNIMYPVFLLENDDAVQAVASMPNVCRYGINQLVPVLEDLVEKGLQSILIFGIIDTLPKDGTGTSADSPQNPVVRALPVLRARFPRLLVACDVCLCPYTAHGHCGVLAGAGAGAAIDHHQSVLRIAQVALAYAKAGAHVVAPSDMMDNRIKAIKDSLVANKLQNQVSVLSYSCKFASSMYGPFRDTMKSSPMEGDRRCYQLPPGSATLAARAAARDVAEGADFLMVKPGLPYLDIVKQTKMQFPSHPLFIYQVSGEYVMISRSGDTQEVRTTLMETLTCMRRAGADCIITYFAPLILSIISGKQ